MAYVLRKKIDLSSFSDDWKDCYLEFNSPSWEDINKLSPKGAKDEEKVANALIMLKDLFVTGMAFDGKDKVVVKAQELEQLPIDMITLAIRELSGKIDPKDEANSSKLSSTVDPNQ